MRYEIWIADPISEGHVMADKTRNRARAIMLARDFDAQGRDARVIRETQDGDLRFNETIYERGECVT